MFYNIFLLASWRPAYHASKVPCGSRCPLCALVRSLCNLKASEMKMNLRLIRGNTLRVQNGQKKKKRSRNQKRVFFEN